MHCFLLIQCYNVYIMTILTVFTLSCCHNGNMLKGFFNCEHVTIVWSVTHVIWRCLQRRRVGKRILCGLTTKLSCSSTLHTTIRCSSWWKGRAGNQWRANVLWHCSRTHLFIASHPRPPPHLSLCQWLLMHPNRFFRFDGIVSPFSAALHGTGHKNSPPH